MLFSLGGRTGALRGLGEDLPMAGGGAGGDRGERRGGDVAAVTVEGRGDCPLLCELPDVGDADWLVDDDDEGEERPLRDLGGRGGGEGDTRGCQR
jgi:hypothetical protein